MHKSEMIVFATALALALASSCGGGGQAAVRGAVFACAAAEPATDDADADADDNNNDEGSVSLVRSSVRTAGPDEQLAPPARFAECADPFVSLDLIDENGRHVWLAYGAEQREDGDNVVGGNAEPVALPTLTLSNASLVVSTSGFFWSPSTHVEVSENGQLLLALHHGGLLGAEGLDVVTESAGLPQLDDCGTETTQRLRFNNELSLEAGDSGAITIDGTSYTVTNLWSTSYDNWNCEDVPNGPRVTWFASRDGL